MALVAALFVAGGHEVLDFDSIKERQAELEAYYAAHPLRTVAVFFGVYVAVATTSLPGGAVLTMLGGALFGAALGALLVSFASTIGATLAFLATRHLLADWLRRRFAPTFRRIDEGVAQDGAVYLFMVRLVPAIPFLLVNVGMGLTRMRVSTYYWVSQAGMLAGTLLFSIAGESLGALQSPSDVLSPRLIAAFVMLAVLPLAARKLVGALRTRFA